MAISNPETPRFQFSVGDLFWLTTVVSLFCATAVYFGREVCVPIAIFFWPTMAAIVILTWPCRSWPARLRFATIIWQIALVVLAAAPFLFGITAAFGDPLRVGGIANMTLMAFILEALIGLGIWLPQALAAFAMLTYLKERNRKKDEVIAATNAILERESHDDAAD